MIEYENIFFFDNLNTIGGVETFFYYLSKKYKNMTIIYEKGDYNQIKRLGQNVKVKQYKGESILCKKAFFNYSLNIIDKVQADEYIQIIHADYKRQEGIYPNNNPKITKYIGVSQVACDSFKEITGKDIELIYNPVEIDKPEDVLLIVSATRLTKEKGLDNIIKIGEKLNQEKIPYLWLIFADSKEKVDAINNPNIIYVSPKLDITSYLKKADIVAQLSKSESFGFTPVESLLVGTPVLLMNLPVYEELGIKDEVHGWIIKNIDKFDVKKLKKKIPKFEYKLPKSNWNKYLKTKSDYNANEMVRVIALRTFDDRETGVHRNRNDIFEMVRWRADYLIDDETVDILE